MQQNTDAVLLHVHRLSDIDAHVYSFLDDICHHLRKNQSTERIDLGYPPKIGALHGTDGLQVHENLKHLTEDKSGVLHKAGIAQALKTVAEAGYLLADNKPFDMEGNNLEDLLERWNGGPHTGSLHAATAADRFKPVYCSVTWDKLVKAAKGRKDAELAQASSKQPAPKKPRLSKQKKAELEEQKKKEEEKKEANAASLKLFMAFWTAYMLFVLRTCPAAVNADTGAGMLFLFGLFGTFTRLHITHMTGPCHQATCH